MLPNIIIIINCRWLKFAMISYKIFLRRLRAWIRPCELSSQLNAFYRLYHRRMCTIGWYTLLYSLLHLIHSLVLTTTPDTCIHEFTWYTQLYSLIATCIAHCVVIPFVIYTNIITNIYILVQFQIDQSFSSKCRLSKVRDTRWSCELLWMSIMTISYSTRSMPSATRKCWT